MRNGEWKVFVLMASLVMACSPGWLADADEPQPAARYEDPGTNAAAVVPSEAQIKQWVRQLGDDKLSVRDAATEALMNAGLPAVLLVRHAKYNGGLEVRNRAERILWHIEQQAVDKLRELTGNPPGIVRVRMEGYSLAGQKNVREALPYVVGLSEAKSLTLQGSDVTDDDLVHIKDMTWLESLHLGDTGITDEGLVNIASLHNLKKLTLSNTAVDGSGFGHLDVLEGLALLDLTRSNVNNNGITKVMLLNGLEEISLKYTRVQNDGLAHLAKCNSLVAVGLEGNSIDDTGVSHLLALKNLKALNLGRTNVTDRCILTLAEMKRLEVVTLFDTKMTIDAMVGLRGLPNLRMLYLPRRIEPNAVDRLKKQLQNPNLHLLVPEVELADPKTEKEPSQ